MRSIKEILMSRDNYTEAEATSKIKRARNKLHKLLAKGKNEDAYYICETEFGLEPDYIDELI